MSSPGSAALIEVKDLVVRRRGALALRGVTFEVAAGQLVGLLGPSGCGKTTLIRSLLGAQVAAEGTIHLFGQPAGFVRNRAAIGYMAQTLSVYLDLTVWENLRYFSSIVDTPPDDGERILDRVGLSEKRHVLIRQLSGGEQARASLAVALLGGPPLLLLDEPTVGLDPLLRRHLWTQFRDLADAGATLVVSSHVMDEAAHCQRLLLMREGRILADTTAADLLARTGRADLESAFVALIEEGRG